MANDTNELREHLFGALKGIKDKSISIEQAKAMCEVSQSLINLAKVEVAYANATGADLTGSFIAPDKPKTPNTGHTVHRLRG